MFAKQRVKGGTLTGEPFSPAFGENGIVGDTVYGSQHNYIITATTLCQCKWNFIIILKVKT